MTRTPSTDSHRSHALTVRRSGLLPLPNALVSGGSVAPKAFFGVTRSHALGRASAWALRHTAQKPDGMWSFPMVTGTTQDLGLDDDYFDKGSRDAVR